MILKLTTIWQKISLKKIGMIILLLLIGVFGFFLSFLKTEIANLKVSRDTVLDLAVKPVLEKIKVDIKGEVVKPGVYNLELSNNIQDLITLAGGVTSKAETKNLNLNKKLEAGLVVNIPAQKAKTNSVKASTKSNQATINNNGNTNNASSSSSTKKVEVTVSSSNNKENNTSASTNTNNNSLPDNDNLNTEPKPNIDTEKASEEEVKEEKEEILVVNINTAGIELLTKLNGIGPAKAQAIIDYRTTNGLFKTIEKIKNVKGIGEAIYDKIKEFICI